MKKHVKTILFLIYIIILLNFTLFNNYFGRNITFIWNTDIMEYINTKVNIVPFKTISFYIYNLFMGIDIKYAIINIFGNLLAFMPFGIFLNNKKNFIIIIILIVLAIEFLQFITVTGSFDIDDLILNVLGALTIYKIWRKYEISY